VEILLRVFLSFVGRHDLLGENLSLNLFFKRRRSRDRYRLFGGHTLSCCVKMAVLKICRSFGGFWLTVLKEFSMYPPVLNSPIPVGTIFTQGLWTNRGFSPASSSFNRHRYP